MTIFKTKIKGIGAEAALFKEEKMIILFGEAAPDGLAEYCYNIEINQTTEPIEEGMQLLVAGSEFEITAVGSVVNQNLNTLGHITIKFDGSKVAELPGTLYVEAKSLPDIKIDAIVEIIAS
ncbi:MULTISPECIES: PTS glucitol/sorbitol transporter subunit IIA [unclassified Enterococcus]|uniref:PTS glucitol/sorbitol transporter subunit IIA n=1 Tax=unclassified Enterococcus TaxID=2608891 RepID=UPI001556BBAE|nr:MULTISPECIES: PTS glucitol/sorbitol transporter subunit IIA [unclassified Enterococcus]MBS7577427.1 PTS glucitol/sorbitol transporter subunit IIA [Enterococcus sp. MMGLQ5-2]MBS7584834.1 PTS glucitol/sorbitol transporter subunit IIA [Enterococcus sp. MMGLQ5-1]NPD12689.1 PTS glucitol/sorbitol transporter subunit IIA [Enterococcus sp. MMGLQ5-1]NPD37261.1 PTS glucitol/sorbitol transporter subunit IIA [Enterococcus sp. MMGLQ5-2]